jgi:hypothetical protein
VWEVVLLVVRQKKEEEGEEVVGKIQRRDEN